MRTFDKVARCFVLLLALALPGPVLAEETYATAGKAYAAGLEAIEARKFDEAFRALQYAADLDEFYAKFALAQLYSSDALPFVDHVKAFHLYAEIADRFGTIDPYLDKRSPYVARALVAVALYEAKGLPAMPLAANTAQAIKDLDYASKYFDDMDAQLELVKIWLKDESDPGNFRRARDLLLRLAREKGHPGAQATLAEMFFSGQTKLGRRPPLALGFATLAVEGAGEDDRLWIDALYHQIYCETAPPVRKRAGAIANRYRKDVRIVEAIREARRKTAIGRITEAGDAEAWGRSLTWVCDNGEVVVWPKRSRHDEPEIDAPEIEALTATRLPSETKGAPIEPLGDAMGAGLQSITPAGAAE
jgi:hypothetical protein